MRDTTTASAIEVLVRLTFETNERLQEHASAAGLSVQQLRLLGILRDREPTINELGKHLNLDKSSVSGLVIRAERRGFVSRTQHERDGRAVRVRLEAPGRELIDRVSSQSEKEMEEFFAVLSDTERPHWAELTARLLVADAHRRGSAL